MKRSTERALIALCAMLMLLAVTRPRASDEDVSAAAIAEMDAKVQAHFAAAHGAP